MKNREIKFRLWHEAIGSVIYEPKTLGSVFVNRFLESDSMIHWMQCTGIKDKNNVEIYEGDILRQQVFGNTWSKDLIIVKYGIYDKCGGCSRQTWGVGFDMGECSSDKIEVIGNIYENKDLLKGYE